MIAYPSVTDGNCTVVISVFALVSRRQWLTRVGPVEVSEQVSDLSAENATLKDMLASERERTERLKNKLAAADDVVRDVFVRPVF
jgi:hypothetical protein